MGRKTDVLLRGFRAAKCLTHLKLATARIKVQRNKRSVSAKQMRGEIAQLLKTGQDAQVYITKADALIKQENMVAFYDLIEQYCHAITARFPMIEMQSNCPIDMKEPIATLIYAAPRCVEISELAAIKEAFMAKYGKEFALAAAELRPDCGVSKQVIELLSIRPATGDMKLKIMKEICAEYNVDWTPGEALAGPSTNMPAGSSQQPAKTKTEAGNPTGDAGSSKATFVPAPPPGVHQAGPSNLRVNQAGPSNLSAGPKFTVQGSKPEGMNKVGLAAASEPSKATFVPAPPSRVNQAGPSNLSAGPKFAVLQGGSKPEGTNKAGLATVVQPLKPGVLATDSSKSSSSIHGSSPGEGAVKANASFLQSVQGAANAGIPSVKPGLATVGSSETAGGAVSATNTFKANDTRDESMGGASLSGLLKSLKGVLNTGTPSAASGSFKEPLGEPAAKSEAYMQPVVDVQEGVGDSDNDSFVSVEEERSEDDAEASSVGGAARRESFGKISLKASVEVDGHGPSLIKSPLPETQESSSSTDRPHEDGYFKASSKKSSFTSESLQEGVFLKAGSKNSLNAVTLQEVKSLRAESRKSSLGEEKSSDVIMESLNTGASQEEKPFRAESRKSSLGEDKSSDLTMESLNTGTWQEERPFRVESRKSNLREEKGSGGIMDGLNTEEKPFRAESRKSSHEDMYLRASSKDSSNSGTVLQEKAFKAESQENILMKLQLQEEQHFEGKAEEGPRRKNISEDVSFGVTTESLVSQMLDEKDPYEEQTNTTTTGDDLQDKDMLEDTSTTETLLVEKLVELKKIVSFSDGLSTEEMPSGAGEEMAGKNASSNTEELPKSVRKHIDSLGALATPDDFAAAAKAIAAEAARLAVLDYAKRMSGSGGIPIDLTDLTKLGLDFKRGSQVDTQEVQNAGDITNDVIKGEASKVEVPVSKHEGIIGDPAKIGGLGHADMEKSMHSKTPIADDGGPYGNNASLNTLGHAGTSAKDEPLQQPDMDVRNDEINPFAIKFDKATNALFSEAVEYDSSSWFDQTKPELMSKAGGFVQEEDHLDVFFRRKTPLFDEDGGYSFAKTNPSLIEEKPPYFGYDDKKERISQDKFFVAAPVFDSPPEKQSLFVEESSGSFKSPGFDYGGPAKYDATLSFDDGLDKSVGAPVRFDSEPEPSFDKVDEEEEQSTIQKSESAQVGQLKWHSKKPTKASSGESLASDTSLGEDSKFLSKRTRKQPQRVHEYAYSSEIPAQAEVGTDEGLASKLPVGSSSSLMQQQGEKQGRYENLRTKPAGSFSYSSDAMGKRPSRSPNRASYDSSKESRSDRWDSPPPVEDRLSSVKGVKSPSRPSKRQEMPLEESDEDFYFSEDIGISSARSSMNRRTTKSPTRMAKQQFLPQGYDDDADAYSYGTKASKMPNFSRQDMADDDTFEEPPVARYKPLRQSDELGMDTAANLRQKPHRRQEDYNSESVRMQYVLDGGVRKSNPTNRPSPHRKQQNLEDEDDLGYGYNTSLQVDIRGKGSSSRPLSNRTKLGEEEGLRYKQSAQVDDQGRASSSPLSRHRQRYQLPQEEEQYEQDEFDSTPFPDRHQGGYRKEQQRLSRPRYQQKQELRLEEENLDSSTEDFEQDQAEQGRPSMLSDQEKQRRRLPAYGQEKQHRPLPLSQDYEEERMPRPLYEPKQDLRMEKEDLDLTLKGYGRPTSFEQEQDGQETKRRPLPSYRQEKQRRPSPPLFEQEEDYQSMQMPDRRQEERRKEKERMSRPHYGQKQGSSLEKETSDLSAEGYELYQEEQWRTSTLSEQEQGRQERQRQRLPPYRQEKQHQPLPPLQQYEEEEEEKEELGSVLLPNRRQREERRKEKEHMSRTPYGRTQDSRAEEANINLSIEDYEQDQEEPGHTSVSSEQEQYRKEKQRQSSPPYGGQVDSKLGRDNSEPRKEEKIRQEQQRLPSDRRQQQSLAEAVARKGQKGREEERSPSPVYRRQQEMDEEKKFSELSMEHNELSKKEKLQYSTAMPEEKQEHDGQGDKKQPWPLHIWKQESKEETPTSGWKQQSSAKEEGSKGQHEKSEIKEQLPARQSLPKDEGVKASQEKLEIKAQPPTRRPPSIPVPPTSPSLESSISDPVILATIPPPVKKPSVVQPAAPGATTLESSISVPSPTSAPEVKVPKPPQKPPNVEDLLANFEALRRARKGE